MGSIDWRDPLRMSALLLCVAACDGVGMSMRRPSSSQCSIRFGHAPTRLATGVCRATPATSPGCRSCGSIDLAKDPDERAPEPLGDHPRRAQLETLVAAIESGEKREEEVDPALVEQLRALGYVE